MTPEKEAFLGCLRDYIHDDKTLQVSDVINKDKLCQFAKKQDLAAIIYEQCKNCRGLEPTVDNLKNSVLAAVFFSVNRADIMREITKRFESEGIPFIFMKGAVIRNCYPIPELRSMGDVDIVIRTEDREKTNRILMEDMGFQRMIDNHAVWTYWLDQFIFEVHDHMFYEELTGEFDYRAYFDRIWEHKKPGKVFGIESPVLFIPDENFHLLFLLTHTAKHLINNGMGFRAFLDMVFAARKWEDELDWKWIEEELTKMDLIQFARTCFSFCERWFDVKMPLEPGKIDEGFFIEVTEKMFADGVFGLDNKDNEGAASAKEIIRSQNSYWISAIALTGKKLFPPYEDMQLIPWYSFIDGRPWLLPAAWVYRWGYCLVKKRKAGTKKLTEPFMKKDLIEKREELINKWGL